MHLVQAPESAVGLFSALEKTNRLSLGNVVGSCIANIALIIGLTATIRPIDVNRPIVKKEIPMSFGIQVFLCILVFAGGSLGRIDGMILLILFALFIYYIAVNSKPKNMTGVKKSGDCIKAGEQIAATNETTGKPKNVIKCIILLAIGLLGLIIGGDMVVDNATNIARLFQINETIIGLTIVSIGTTLPEMVATLTAVFRRQTDIAVGNILGSNIFNIVCVLGISAIVNPITNINLTGSADALIFDMAFMVAVTVILFSATAIKHRVPRWMGFIFLLYYISYVTFKVITVM